MPSVDLIQLNAGVKWDGSPASADAFNPQFPAEHLGISFGA
jgi:hypothetical protein